MSTETCGHTLYDLRVGSPYEIPCDRPATSWRWYQDVPHEDALLPACDLHENEGGRRMRRAEAAVERALQFANGLDVDFFHGATKARATKRVSEAIRRAVGDET